jgi:hypothetical protein
MSIRINLDPTNPGQFFACCGLLELADRLWPGAEGQFLNREFLLTAQGSLTKIIKELTESSLSVCANEGEPSIHPVRLANFDLKLSWWLRDDWSRFQDKPKEKRVGFMKTALKFWAANASSGQIAGRLLDAMPHPKTDNEARYFEPSECISTRFGLDAGPAWTALDVGFSINEHPIGVKTSAAVELLAAIGLQRCRPIIHEKGIDYVIWRTPLSPLVLSAAVCGQIANDSCTWYRSRVIDRGSFAAFSHSFPLRGDFRE